MAEWMPMGEPLRGVTPIQNHLRLVVGYDPRMLWRDNECERYVVEQYGPGRWTHDGLAAHIRHLASARRGVWHGIQYYDATPHIRLWRWHSAFTMLLEADVVLGDDGIIPGAKGTVPHYGHVPVPHAHVVRRKKKYNPLGRGRKKY